MNKYVFKPYSLGKNIVGFEINFNKEFYVPEKLEKVEDVLMEIVKIEKEIGGIQL